MCSPFDSNRACRDLGKPKHKNGERHCKAGEKNHSVGTGRKKGIFVSKFDLYSGVSQCAW